MIVEQSIFSSMFFFPKQLQHIKFIFEIMIKKVSLVSNSEC